MKPAVDLVLSTLVDGMARQLAFVPPGGERMKLMGMKVLLGILARQADDAAALRLAEIRELQALLQHAAGHAPPPLAGQLRDAAAGAAGAADDLRISALERALDGLRAALIELQAWLETTDHPEAPALARQCWALLVRANARRQVPDKPW